MEYNEIMNKEIQAIDDGMIHEAIIENGKLKIFKNPFAHIDKNTDPNAEVGYVAVEFEHLENESGREFGMSLSNFHGEIIII